MRLKCVIVDDEPLAIRLLQNFVERTSFLMLVDTFLNPVDALAAITSEVQLVFLDIEMPGLTGLELSKLIVPETRIIFTTAYKQYAFDSYEVQALDYLLKPITYAAFLKAARRGKVYFDGLIQQYVADKISDEQEENKAKPSNCIFVKSDYKLIKVDLDNILYISGLRDYVRIHLQEASRPLTALTTMKAIAEKLPSERFCRVHRSYIVALDKIESIEHNRIKIKKELIPLSEANVEELMRRISH